MVKIAIGSDHGGYELKEEIKKTLEAEGIKYKDFGTMNEKSVDFGPIAKKVAESVADDKYNRGILICGTGIGMSIMANKVKGIRAALVNNVFSAEASRAHNNSNILCMGARVIGAELAKMITRVWLKTEFEGGRHKRRIDFISDYQNAD
ncbi:MAG: ribose 5-phosphate isomerase B [Halanaerobium sp.]|nr:MAG: ribose 5-phosphate isomerase B [Halanaerobium sp.]